MFIDANVVLRWLLNDHPEHSAQAQRLIDAAEPNSLLVTDVTLAEVYYVLCSTKRMSNREVADIFMIMMEQECFGFDEETRLTLQTRIIAETTLDFADCYLIARAILAHQPLKTFDKPMQRVYDKYKTAR